MREGKGKMMKRDPRSVLMGGGKDERREGKKIEPNMGRHMIRRERKVFWDRFG